MTDRIKNIIDNKRIFFYETQEGVNSLYGLYDLIKENFRDNFIVCEIGSFAGVSSELFALTCKEVFCIDEWRSYYDIYVNSIFQHAEYSFDKKVKRYNNIHKIKGNSKERYIDFNDNFFDAIYIDGDHSYEGVKNDIIAWLPKIKRDGFICGHDYANISDIKRVVDEIFNNCNIKLYSDNSWIVSLKEFYSNNVFEKKESKINNIIVSFVGAPKVEILGEGDDIYKVEFIDNDNKKVIYYDFIRANFWASATRHFVINWLIKVYREGVVIFEHEFNLKDKRVLISFDSKSLGDSIAWMPYVEEFRKKNNCHVVLSTFWNNLFKNEYKDIEFVSPGTTVHNLYSQYNIGCWDGDYTKNKNDWRTIPIQKIAADILGLEYREIKPHIHISDRKNTINDKYVCIGIHSTSQCKYWNCDNGWQDVVDYLNGIGYKVVLISKERGNYMGNLPPNNIIDKSGDISIEDRIVDLKNSELFIGVSSGLSWLAWVIGVPVILISGCTMPFNEFKSNVIRLQNPCVCNGCFNDEKIKFNRGEWKWCPKNKDFECTKNITSNDVICKIKEVLNNGEC